MASLSTVLPVAIISAIARNRVIGVENRLPWRAPSDLKRFRTLTSNCPIIVGRKTFESMPHPLPDREMIVVTTNRSWSPPHPTIHVVHDLQEAIELGQLIGDLRQAHAIWIAGGAAIYEQAIPFADQLHLTIMGCTPEGDAFFPDIPLDVWGEVGLATHEVADGGLLMRRMTFERVAAGSVLVQVEGEIANDPAPTAAEVA